MSDMNVQCGCSTILLLVLSLFWSLLLWNYFLQKYNVKSRRSCCCQYCVVVIFVSCLLLLCVAGAINIIKSWSFVVQPCVHAKLRSFDTRTRISFINLVFRHKKKIWNIMCHGRARKIQLIVTTNPAIFWYIIKSRSLAVQRCVHARLGRGKRRGVYQLRPDHIHRSSACVTI